MLILYKCILNVFNKLKKKYEKVTFKLLVVIQKSKKETKM